MRNNKFKLSDMIPNAWFYKLKEIGKTKNQTTSPSKKKKQPFSLSSTTSTHSSKPNQPNQCNPRKSYYFTRELNQNNTKFSTSPPSNNSNTKTPQTPSKNKTRKRRTTTLTSKNSSSSPKHVTSSVSAGCSCRTTLESVWTKSDSPHENSSSSPLDSLTESESPDPEFRTDRVLIPTEPSFDEMVSLTTSSCACNKISNNNIDIVIDVDKNSLSRKDDKLEGHDYSYDSFSKLELPPIITKPTMKNEHKPIKEDSLKIKIINQEQQKKKNKKKKNGSVNSPGVKLRIKSPRLATTRKIQFHHGRKSLSSTTVTSGYRRSFSGSLAIVKSSFNPQKDFRESMVEMIVENNIRASKDLEDLLACYLSLNSDEYHDLIIKVFKQIWFDLTETG